MSEILIKNPSETQTYRVSVDDIGVQTLGAISIAAITGLTLSATADNSTTPVSMLLTVGGGTHGQIYQLTASIALSGGTTLIRTITMRCSASL